MCGIAGVLTSEFSAREPLERHAKVMADTLSHRGPDDHGLWSDPEAGIAIAHRRLSIVDLSPAGHQPMQSADGRLVVAFNGEIFNFQELRPELEARGLQFRGYSDTEVMLEAFATFGIEPTLKRLMGMFAICIWDRQTRTLTLIRDRLGVKPLYWAQFGKLFMFGSELKALRAYPSWTPRIDLGAVASYMRHNYISAPHTIYEGVNKLEAGCILTLPWQGTARIKRYWNAREVAISGLSNPLLASDSELITQLEALLIDSVRRRMVADVPVGAFLSGGIDSSTIVALMQAAKAGPVRSYSIGFDVPGYDESTHAAAVARHLNTEHTELTVTSKQALDVIPNLPSMYDEPFADPSQIPTYLVSAMTRQHVTVALSGDGGDELFGGYYRYQLATSLERWFGKGPRCLRTGLANIISAVPAHRWSSLLSVFPASIRPWQVGDKLHKFAAVLPCNDGSDIYRQLLTHWNPAAVAPTAPEKKGVLWDPNVDACFPNLLTRMQYLDAVTYLPDDILTKVDRASMSVSLEARVPFLDHRVFEFAWRLGLDKRVRNGVTKWLLRQVLYRHVPRELIERPKMGFAVPLGDWLRGPLRPWAEELLEEKRLSAEGIFNAQVIREAWKHHLTGDRNLEYKLWGVLMLESWRGRWAC